MTFTISIGKYGGFYWQRGFATRLCLGFVAITIWPFDVDFYLEQQMAEITRLRMALATPPPHGGAGG